MAKRMTVVIDTSVFISIFRSKSKTSNVQKIWQSLIDEEFIAITTKHTIEELILILKRQKFSEQFIKEKLKIILKKSIYYEGNYETSFLDKIDPKDNIILAACLESNADYLVSLDKRDLLPIKYFHGTQIVSPDIFLRLTKKNSCNLSQKEAIEFITKEVTYIVN